MADNRMCVCGVVHLHSGCPILARAVKALSDGARIGLNPQYDLPYFVGTFLHGGWKQFGAGKTWEEAFASIKKVKFQKGSGRFEYEKE